MIGKNDQLRCRNLELLHMPDPIIPFLFLGLCFGIGILCFPAGWDNAHVRGICGPEANDYKLGDCGIRWGYVLAVIAFFDAW